MFCHVHFGYLYCHAKQRRKIILNVAVSYQKKKTGHRFPHARFFQDTLLILFLIALILRLIVASDMCKAIWISTMDFDRTRKSNTACSSSLKLHISR
jgi:hypothetical protein